MDTIEDGQVALTEGMPGYVQHRTGHMDCGTVTVGDVTEKVEMGYPRQTWHLASLIRSQWISPERLAELQDARLQGMVRHAFDSVPPSDRRRTVISHVPGGMGRSGK